MRALPSPSMSGTPSTPPPESPTPVLFLGVLGVVLPPAAGAAWLLGNRYLRRCGVHGVEPDAGAVWGRTLGMVMSFVWVPAVVVGCAGGAVWVALISG